MASFITSPRAARSLLLASAGLWCVVVVFWVNLTLTALHARNSVPLPFGVFTVERGVYAQDFSYNMLYLEGIQRRIVAHPYRMQDQEKMMRQVLPLCTSGMTHAYSPVTLVLAQPLLAMSGHTRFLVYTLISAAGIILLFHYVLLPRVETTAQVCALAVCLVSVCVFLAFELGQSVLITTTLLGGFWVLLRDRPARPRLGTDCLLALVFWALCLKPSVAILPVMLLLGARAWRPFVLGIVFLLVTWNFTAPLYGGWWTGLNDYFYLLNHYNGEEMTTFMQRGAVPKTFLATLDPHFEVHVFALERALILALSAALVLLRWTGRITASDHFQAMIAIFLLFSPYLLPSEDWILCLLAAEGSFFRGRFAWGKIVILAGIMDLRSNLTFPVDINYPLRLVLFGWMLLEYFQKEKTALEPFKNSAAPI